MAKTRQAALTQGKKLNLTGAHKMPDGMWHPGNTHTAFLNATKKKGEKK